MATNPHVIDVQLENFEEAVLLRSQQVPVLIDFWAPWCGPCRTLGPVLEKLAAEMRGAFVLAKINSDDNQEIAYQFGVQGIPAVFLMKNAQIVDHFTGVQSEAKIRQMLAAHVEAPEDEGSDLDRAADYMERGERDAARRIYEQALKQESDAAAARLGLARIALAESDLDAASEHIGEIPTVAEEFDDGQALLVAVKLAAEAAEIGDSAACEARVKADAKDLEAHYALGGHAVAAGRFRMALEHYLEVARLDRTWREEAGRKAMVTVFGIVGARHPLAEEFREDLRGIYY